MSSRKISSWEQGLCQSLRLEFIKTAGGLYGYLDILSPAILNRCKFEDSLTFTASTVNREYTLHALPLKGNQRFLLPESEVNILLNLFQNEIEIYLKVGGYTATFSSYEFMKAYHRF